MECLADHKLAAGRLFGCPNPIIRATGDHVKLKQGTAEQMQPLVASWDDAASTRHYAARCISLPMIFSAYINSVCH